MNLRSLRLAAGLKQVDVALHLEVRTSTLSRWERGFEMPSEPSLRQIAALYSTSPDELRTSQAQYMATVTPGEGYTTRPANENSHFPRAVEPRHGEFRVLDLFCGSGGFSYGFEQTGEFAVTEGIDLLSDRVETFRANHPKAHVIVGDIREYPIERLDAEALSPDVIIGGPPCQGFSSIRPFRSLTEGDGRNNLYEQFALIVAELRPRWFVLENVLGMLTNRRGESLRELLVAFRAAGYSVDWQVVNAAHFGLPQNRERLLVVGNHENKVFEWPLLTHETNYRSMAGHRARRLTPDPIFSGWLRPAITVMEAIHDLPEVKAGESANWYRDDVVATAYERKLRGASQELTLHQATAHTRRMLDIIAQAGSNRAVLPDGLTSSGFSSSYSRLDPDRPSVTLTVNFVHPASNKCIHPFQDRALTPREGARLQGFPDSFEFCGTRTHIVKQIGNAVPPILGRVIAEGIAAQW